MIQGRGVGFWVGLVLEQVEGLLLLWRAARQGPGALAHGQQFLEALTQFTKRERRFGALPEAVA